MERTTLYQDDLTEERQPSPVQREVNAHVVARDPDIDADDDADDDNDDDDDEDEDLDD